MAVNKMEMSLLCDVYGNLLSDSQREALEMYVNDDFSLAEIAENTGISRQGVRGQINHAAKQLEMYEEKLGLLKRFQIISEDLTKISENENVKKDAELLELVDVIKKQVNFD